MRSAIRGVLLGLLGAAAVLSAASCEGSTAPARRTGSAADVCTWSSRASAGALIDSGAGLYSVDPTNGQVLGRCTGENEYSDEPYFEVGGSGVARSTGDYYQPPVAGDHPEFMPANDVDVDKKSARGGVRALAGGARHLLRFPGWVVVTASDQRLVLQRATSVLNDRTTSHKPADWCVLPTYSAPLSSCRRVPGSTVPGTPAIAPDGTITWVPVEARPLTVGSLHGYAATDGRLLTGFVASRTDTDPIPVGADMRSILFPAGYSVTPASAQHTLQWATVSSTGGRLHATLHDSRITADDASGSRGPLIYPEGGFQASPDGHTIAVLGAVSTEGVHIVTDTGRVSTVPLHLPRVSIQLVRWPFTYTGTAQP